jgi:cytochrome bd-type quinol oxidase subunit 1
MPPAEPTMRGERPDDNPYAPPRTEISPAVAEKETDDVGNERTKHLRHESCIRITGLIGLVVAGCVVLNFGLSALSEFYRQEDEGFEPWMYRRWVARMISVISIAVLAFITSWGLFRLRNWGRWALTIVTTLPVPALVCGWLLRNLAQDPGVQGMVNPAGLTTLSMISALSCALLLFLMWSPKGEMVFSQ